MKSVVAIHSPDAVIGIRWCCSGEKVVSRNTVISISCEHYVVAEAGSNSIVAIHSPDGVITTTALDIIITIHVNVISHSQDYAPSDCVIAFTAFNGVVTEAAVQHVVTVATTEIISSATFTGVSGRTNDDIAQEYVIAAIAIEPVAAIRAVKPIVAESAVKVIVSRATVQLVVFATTAKRVITGMPQQGIIAVAAPKGVVTCPTVDVVTTEAARNRVVSVLVLSSFRK